jgi:VWFA-related protein
MPARRDRFLVFVITAMVSLAEIRPLATIQGTEQLSRPADVYRSGVKVIVQTVTVRGKDGKPIEGLTAEDFSVTEDGKPQELAFLEFRRLPTAPQRSPQPHDKATSSLIPPVAAGRGSSPVPRDGRYRDRRLLVLFFDQAAMSSPDQARAFAAAERYVAELMSSADMIAVVTNDDRGVRIDVDFTDDRPRLLEAMRRRVPGPDEEVLDVGSAFGQDSSEAIFNTDRQLSALQSAVSLLDSVPEQKTLLYFTGGVRLNSRDNYAQLRATTNAAIRANVTIHPIDARGLVAHAPSGDATWRSSGGIAVLTGRQADETYRSQQRSQDTLYSIAKDTGGTVLLDHNDLSLGIRRAADTVSSHYLLGFYTTHTAKDGRYRRVQVTLKNGRQGELTYRRGYFADKTFALFSEADKERQLEQAMMLENPVTEIGMAVEINYFMVNSADYFVPVAVRVPGRELSTAAARGAAPSEFDFIGEVKDEFGVTIQNVRDKVNVRWGDASASLQYETGFTLLPGDYSIKLLVREAATGRLGTYQTSFTIPNLAREEAGLPVSSVVLASQRTALTAAGYTVNRSISEKQHPLISDGLKLMPSVSRVFSRQRDLYVLLHAYPGRRTSAEPIVAYVTFFRDSMKVFETSPLVVSPIAAESSGAIPLKFTVPLHQVPAGQYDCQVSVLDPTSQKGAFWRAPMLVVH